MAHNRKSIGAARKQLKGSTLLIREPFIWTEKQNIIIECILSKKTKAVFIAGPPGVGKTELAVFAGLRSLQSNAQQRVLYVRTIVESASNRLGFLPGTDAEKISPYMQVFAEKLEGMLNPNEIDDLTKNKKLIAMPNNFIRGRDLKDSIVIADEFQNYTFLEAKSLTSRLGENSKIVYLFDPEQSDIASRYRHDASNFRDIFNDEESKEQGIFCFSFDESEIKRSEFCKFVMQKLKLANPANP